MSELEGHYPTALTLEWLRDAGVEKDTVKKLSDFYPDGAVPLDTSNLEKLTQNGVNLRLIVNNLLSPEHKKAVTSELDAVFHAWVEHELKAQHEFFISPHVAAERAKYSARNGSVWEEFKESGYSAWGNYMHGLSEAIAEFDLATAGEHEIYLSSSKSNRAHEQRAEAVSIVSVISEGEPMGVTAVLGVLEFQTNS